MDEVEHLRPGQIGIWLIAKRFASALSHHYCVSTNSAPIGIDYNVSTKAACSDINLTPISGAFEEQSFAEGFMNDIPQSISSTSESKPLSIVYTSIGSLRAYARNARTHTKRQIKLIAESITAFGFTNPILTDQNNTIVAGHGRVEAAKLIGMAKVPTVRLENLTEDQI
jgi:hypothetical protein